ncbi:MAG: non-heme iron oxygenase ferredoxin subunit [Firmicutes bacterium]|nr:non-heme iron oxygenase ferredoxin subunit [Bacillota bacterium]
MAWIRVAEAADVEPGRPLLVSLDEQDIALYRVGNEWYATDDLCSHAEASLAEGRLDGYRITCPRHGGQFDIRTGEAIKMPAITPIATFPVREEGGVIYIDYEP